MAAESSNPPRALAVAVFCGTSTGRNPAFMGAAKALASALHAQGWSLVYGGGSVGMMGEVARTLISLGGSVHGIIPRALLPIERARNPDGTSAATGSAREALYGSLTVVEDMHARKTRMAAEADAFVALPGGFGTMEELMEIITWNFLGIHDKPVVVFNVDGYYDDVMRWVERAVEEGFVNGANRGIVVEARTAEEVVENILGYRIAEKRYSLDWGTQKQIPGTL